jgi:large subunit ribosomal protein L13
MKTFVPKPSDIQRAWHLVDAAGQPLGRLAVIIANLLRGRTKAIYTPHVDTGDFVVVTNAAQVKLTGRKNTQKTYWSYSGYRGGRKTVTAAVMRQRHPERIIEKAVRGMLPDTHTRRLQMKRLKVYAGAEHPHAAQAPQPIGRTNA